MAKLYPPILGGVTPAFYGTVLKVPYTMNKTVIANDFKGFKLMIKSVSTGRVVTDILSSTSFFKFIG